MKNASAVYTTSFCHSFCERVGSSDQRIDAAVHKANRSQAHQIGGSARTALRSRASAAAQSRLPAASSTRRRATLCEKSDDATNSADVQALAFRRRIGS